MQEQGQTKKSYGTYGVRKIQIMLNINELYAYPILGELYDIRFAILIWVAGCFYLIYSRDVEIIALAGIGAVVTPLILFVGYFTPNTSDAQLTWITPTVATLMMIIGGWLMRNTTRRSL